MELRRYGGLAAAVFVGFAGGALALHEKNKILHKEPSNFLYASVKRFQGVRASRSDGAVIFLGDSHTAGLPMSKIGAPAENLGVPGITIADLTDEVSHYDLTRAGCLVVEVGINNWGRDRLEGFLPNYRKLLDALPPGIPVLAVGIMPTNGNSKHDLPQLHLIETVAKTNNLIDKACDERSNCTFLDMGPILGEHGVLTPANDSGDGLHLSPAGYEKWESVLKADKCVSAHTGRQVAGVST